jgi:hypothetical protein
VEAFSPGCPTGTKDPHKLGLKVHFPLVNCIIILVILNRKMVVHLGFVWERMKESARNCPYHEMEAWIILHLFYHALNLMTKSMFHSAARGAFTGK